MGGGSTVDMDAFVSVRRQKIENTAENDILSKESNYWRSLSPPVNL